MSGPIHPTSINWIMRFRGDAGVLIQAAIEVKNSFLSLKVHFS